MADPAPETNTFDLRRFPIHLGLGATSIPQPEHTGDMEWYGGYGERNMSDGIEGRLVTMSTFTQPWDVWEMHPKGTELVIVTDGVMTIHQEKDGQVITTDLAIGDVAINQPGVWHTVDAEAPVTVVFITAGAGTEHRPR